MSEVIEVRRDDAVVTIRGALASGRYHHESVVQLANRNAERRGDAIRFLLSQLPSNSPYRKLPVAQLAKLADDPSVPPALPTIPLPIEVD